ncbi:hypothetical protein GYMLUDRAFT_37227 [Collybiopsis luxurians FD-317 M1]|nr:hypothetical protein GYMLUDRAFT_37227 [Collybiopsis luxurians FD-317 M1]
MNPTITAYIVAGTVSGFVALNLTLFFVWWFFLKPRRRVPTTIEDTPPVRRRTPSGVSSVHARTDSISSSKHKRIDSISSTKHALSMAVTLPQPSLSVSFSPDSTPGGPPDTSQIVPPVTFAKKPRIPSSRKPDFDQFTTAPQKSKSIRSYERRKSRYLTPDFPERNLQRGMSQRSQRSQRSYRSRFSQRSVDSESMYSVASASTDMHERLFQPMFSRLETIVASPQEQTFPHRTRAGYLQAGGHSGSPSSPSSTPQNIAPRFLSTPPPPSPLIIKKPNYNPLSLLPPDASSFPDSAFIPDPIPPRVPPRSPLRNI